MFSSADGVQSLRHAIQKAPYGLIMKAGCCLRDGPIALIRSTYHLRSHFNVACACRYAQDGCSSRFGHMDPACRQELN